MNLTKDTKGISQVVSPSNLTSYCGYEFIGDISINDDLTILLDGGIHVTGNVNVAGNIFNSRNSNLLVDGYVNVGDDMHIGTLNVNNYLCVGGHIISYGSLFAKEIVVTEYIEFSKFGSYIISRDNIEVGDYIQAEAIRARGDIKVGGNIETMLVGHIQISGSKDAGGSLVAGGSIESGGFISTGSYIKAGENVKAKKFITAGGKEQHSFEAEKYGSYGNSDIQAGGDICAGEYIHVDFIESGRDVIAGRGIDANVIYAQRYISAGKEELISCCSISEGKVVSGILKEFGDYIIE